MFVHHEGSKSWKHTKTQKHANCSVLFKSPDYSQHSASFQL